METRRATKASQARNTTSQGRARTSRGRNRQSSLPTLPVGPENTPNVAVPQQRNKISISNDTAEQKVERRDETRASLEEEKAASHDRYQAARQASRIRAHEQQIAEEQDEEYTDPGKC